MARALIALTAASSLETSSGAQHPTGYWAEEFVVAHRALVEAGHDVTIATPGGRPAPVDPGSVAPAQVGEELASEFTAYIDALGAALTSPAVLEDQDAGDYAAIVMPGGHGPMADLAFSESFGALLTAADASGTVIAPFCHGPAGLLAAKNADGEFLFKGRRMTAFTDGEEKAGGMGDETPWFLASRLTELGAEVEAGAAWSSHVVIDGNLISGQNPQSSAAVSAAVVDAIA